MKFDDVFGADAPIEGPEINFANFLTLFPAIELPVNLSSELTRSITEIQFPLKEEFAVRFLLQEDEWLDDYTEFMPCFQLPKLSNFYALVFWKASLLGNGYHLMTFNGKGEKIDYCALAGTRYEDNEIIQTVCSIQTNFTISQVLGRLDARTGKALGLNKEDQCVLQLTTEGDIIEL